jgi:hypothetical protein
MQKKFRAYHNIITIAIANSSDWIIASTVLLLCTMRKNIKELLDLGVLLFSRIWDSMGSRYWHGIREW